MAANRGLSSLADLADEGIRLCQRYSDRTTIYMGSRTAQEYERSNSIVEKEKNADLARIAEIMTELNADNSWLTAPLRPS